MIMKHMTEAEALQREKNKIPLYHSGQSFSGGGLLVPGYGIEIIGILKDKSVTNIGVSNWDELLDERHNIKKRYYPDICYMVSYDSVEYVMTGNDIYWGQLWGFKFMLLDKLPCWII